MATMVFRLKSWLSDTCARPYVVHPVPPNPRERERETERERERDRLNSPDCLSPKSCGIAIAAVFLCRGFRLQARRHG